MIAQSYALFINHVSYQTTNPTVGQTSIGVKFGDISYTGRPFNINMITQSYALFINLVSYQMVNLTVERG